MQGGISLNKGRGVKMFINGALEWIGENARTFLMTRSLIEQRLLALGYEYFYGGILSKRSVYEAYFRLLGENFQGILVDFDFQGKTYILAPEYTFRVFEYLNRSDFPENGVKIFYSQEMMRNETESDIKQGKTFSFWQAGYEIFGKDDRKLLFEAITTLWECLSMFPLENLRFRISDKRILEAVCRRFSVMDAADRNRIASIADACGEDGNSFYDRYTQEGGKRELAQELRRLLNLTKKRLLTVDLLREAVGNEAEPMIKDLESVKKRLERICGFGTVEIVTFMPKSWEAYTTFVYDARVDGFDKAVAGGGNLFIDPSNPNCVHSGAGIGVSRIAQYLIEKEAEISVPDSFFSPGIKAKGA